MEAIRIEFGVRAPLCVRSGLTFHVGAAMGEAKAEAKAEGSEGDSEREGEGVTLLGVGRN